jgi:hypothetical protein
MTPAPDSPLPAPAAPTFTHSCVRCGAPVDIDVGLCERCNPLGLKDSAASQVHGTVFLAVTGAIVTLAILARLAVSGMGPFTASVDDVATAGEGLAITLSVTNAGSSEGQTTCRVVDPNDRNGVGAAIVLSPRIAPGATATFTTTVIGLGTVVRPLVAECTSP